jgi:hypothetical protein
MASYKDHIIQSRALSPEIEFVEMALAAAYRQLLHGVIKNGPKKLVFGGHIISQAIVSERRIFVDL